MPAGLRAVVGGAYEIDRSENPGCVSAQAGRVCRAGEGSGTAAGSPAESGFAAPLIICFSVDSASLMIDSAMRILVVEDDKKIASFVVKGLKQSGFAVDQCADGEDALSLATTTTYDAAILDIMLPKLDGLSVVQRLRSQGNHLPVLMLSAKVSVDDRVRGLQAGGDDYLTKPFAFSELLARIQALIRRATHSAEPTKLVVGDLTLDLLARAVTRGEETIELQPREFMLLEYLMRHANRAVSKTMILEHVWDYSFDPQTNVVDVLVHRLRAKVDPEKTRLHTVRGVGYVLRPA